MNQQIKYNLEILRATRQNTLKLVNHLSYDQLTTIPKGFSNSILWNFVHSIVSQQLLVYALSSNEMHLKKEIIDPFRKNSDGKAVLSKEDLEQVKGDYLDTINLLEKDIEMLMGSEFKSYPTSYNITLNSVEESINFSNTHEALHLGIMIAMSKLI